MENRNFPTNGFITLAFEIYNTHKFNISISSILEF